MSVERLKISYDDFKLLEVIDPEQFDINNAELVGKINQLVDILNSFVTVPTPGDDGSGDPVYVGDLRGNVVKINPISPFTSTDVETFLGELTSRLRSIVVGSSGAELIGSAPIEGLNGNSVYTQIQNIVVQIKELATDSDSNSENLSTHIQSADHDTRYYTKTLSDERYLQKTDADTKFETKTNVSNALSNKTDKTGDHDGTWQGYRPTDFATVGQGGTIDIPEVDYEDIRLSSDVGLSVEVRTSDPVSAYVGQIWLRTDIGGDV